MSLRIGNIDIYTVFVLYFFKRKNGKTKFDWVTKTPLGVKSFGSN